MKTGVKRVLTFIAASFLSLGSVIGQNGEEAGAPTGKGPKYGNDSVTCVVHLSLYREFYRQNNYKDAFPHWRWAFLNCPLSSQNLYIDGAKLVSDRIEKATDQTVKDAYFDTLMMVYDQRILSFNREAYVLGRKGMEMITYKPQEVEANYETLKKSIELGGFDSESAAVAYYFQTVLAMVQAEKLEKIAVIDTYDQLSNIIDHNMTKFQDDPKKIGMWGSIKGNIEAAFEPFATCTDLIPLYEKKFAATPDDTEMLIKMTNMLDKKGCNDSEIFFLATERLHSLQPGAKSAYLMGSLSREKKQISKAIDYLNQAIELADNNDDKIKSLNLLAAINYEQRNYSQARSNAQKILQLNPNYGKAYIFIGDLYAASSSLCTDDNFAGKTVFWAAIDMYQKARNADPSVADEASGKIAQYSKYFPPKDDLFFHDIHPGDSFTVGCWINETTSVRAGQ